MADPFLSEIRLMSFNYAPKGWALCDGQILPINQNQALFSLLGTTYGGNGQTNFALPDLRGRVPISFGNGHTLGERGGEVSHTVSVSETPTHTHPHNVSRNNATTPTPGNTLTLAKSVGASLYASDASALVSMDTASLTTTGGSQPHLNMQPFLVLNYCIALQGIYPSQN